MVRLAKTTDSVGWNSLDKPLPASMGYLRLIPTTNPIEILVPRWADLRNNNPQNLNAIAMLSRFRSREARWNTFYYHSPHPQVLASKQVRLTKLWHTRLWKLHTALQYQRPLDAIFYPGVEREDETGWKLRGWTGRRVPLIATMESLVGDAERERLLSGFAGHDVFCARVSASRLRWIDTLYRNADLVIAISPFLAKMGTRLYGDKFKVHSLGVDTKEFSPRNREANARLRVMNVASFQERKRPELFLKLAGRFPEADFVWIGGGPRWEECRAQAKQSGLTNLSFPGPSSHETLPDLLSSADVFVLTSNSEGVPKVTQEAAACGVPVVLFGYFESPSVIHGKNGFVVWNVDELHEAVGALLADPQLRATMGEKGRTMAEQWDWDILAPNWENEILRFCWGRSARTDVPGSGNI